MEGHQLGLISVAVSPDGNSKQFRCPLCGCARSLILLLLHCAGLATSSMDSQIRLFDLETGALQKEIDAGPG